MAVNQPSGSFHPDYVCPNCHVALAVAPDSLHCGGCNSFFPVERGVADFSGGRYYDNFVPGQALPEEHLEGLEEEVSGAVSRIQGFYLPLLRKRIRRPAAEGNPLRVLDCGCGNGVTVDLLNEAGFATWGNDSSALRKWQWEERKNRQRLVVAEGPRLPFPDGHFDAVISSGVLEHVGVTEIGGERYSVAPRADRDAERQRFLSELLRVVRPRGRVWIDAPNGASPIDFWHGTTESMPVRWHGRREGFLPTVSEVRRYLAAIGPDCTIRILGPHRRLRFKRIRKYWYGRAFNIPARLFLWGLSLPVARILAGTWINPYLVLEITRGRPAQLRE